MTDVAPETVDVVEHQPVEPTEPADIAIEEEDDDDDQAEARLEEAVASFWQDHSILMAPYKKDSTFAIKDWLPIC